MKHTARYTTLHETIVLFMDEAQLPSSQYLRIYQLAVRGLGKLVRSVHGEPITRLLTVRANKTAELPSDYIQWVKIGSINDQGEVATLTRNRNLSKLNANAQERLQSLAASAAGSTNEIFCNYNQDGSVVHLLGIPGGLSSQGEFTVDEVNGLILLDGEYGLGYVLLEYIADPMSSEDSRFPIQCQEALIAWLRWMNIVSLPSGRRQNMALIYEYKDMWHKARKVARYELRPFYLQEANDIIRLTNRASIRS